MKRSDYLEETKNKKKKTSWRGFVKKAVPVLLMSTMALSLSACDLPDFFVSCNGGPVNYEVVIPDTKKEAVSQAKKMIKNLKKDNFTYAFVNIGASNGCGETIIQTIRRDGDIISTENSNGDARGVLDVKNQFFYYYVPIQESWRKNEGIFDYENDYIYEAYEIINEVPSSLSSINWKSYDAETKTLSGKVLLEDTNVELQFTDEGANINIDGDEASISEIGTTEVEIPNTNNYTRHIDSSKDNRTDTIIKQIAYIQEKEREL